ncbi:hypothetical protein HNP65_000332 [Thermosipho japonicus]|uniref:Uncharacterized protein n=1 Tax=Thermosipho japonicus TaxID=90323 RepID=A0A841GS36_9BACT|nr:hypothetical protein [Thermosipho japonicus]MBB6061910.1 hypothetical protein [Thermosipho japonicus]
MSKLYEDFLRTLDEEIEKSSPKHREQVKILFLKVWYNTFLKNSIAQFMENFKHIRYKFSREIRYEAALASGRALRKVSVEVRV